MDGDGTVTAPAVHAYGARSTERCPCLANQTRRAVDDPAM